MKLTHSHIPGKKKTFWLKGGIDCTEKVAKADFTGSPASKVDKIEMYYGPADTNS